MRSLSSLCAVALGLVAAASPAAATDARHPRVIELFQSQGCSSCPPANANLVAWTKRDDTLALNFAVDYWDALGWKDTFARPEFTARQWAYARALGHGEVYTPQTIVNGRVDVTGADAAELEALARREDRGAGGPELSLEAGVAQIGAGEAPAGGADVWLARYDPAIREVAVGRGENAGRRLPHADIVVEFVRLGGWRGGAERFDLPPKSDPRLAEAVIVQAAGAGPILAAVKQASE